MERELKIKNIEDIINHINGIDDPKLKGSIEKHLVNLVLFYELKIEDTEKSKDFRRFIFESIINKPKLIDRELKHINKSELHPDSLEVIDAYTKALGSNWNRKYKIHVSTSS
jgi:hypothetical protein